jgi:hypothetical protein
MLINNYGHSKSQHNAHRIDFFSSIGGDGRSTVSKELVPTGVGGGTILGFIAANVLNFGIFCISASIFTLSSLVRLRHFKFLSDVISSWQRSLKA